MIWVAIVYGAVLAIGAALAGINYRRGWLTAPDLDARVKETESWTVGQRLADKARWHLCFAAIWPVAAVVVAIFAVLSAAVWVFQRAHFRLVEKPRIKLHPDEAIPRADLRTRRR